MGCVEDDSGLLQDDEAGMAGEACGHHDDRGCTGADMPVCGEAARQEDHLGGQHRQRAASVGQRSHRQAVCVEDLYAVEGLGNTTGGFRGKHSWE